ncbi:MAG: hypothetical protein ACOCWO_04430, partial [Candidatus Muiribacteriaceae bacterium]
MTIAISIKVNEGIVLAADSASTVFGKDPKTQQEGIVNTYNNTNKIFNLRKDWPIGMITWGAGSLGPLSISVIAKNFRNNFSERNGSEKCNVKQTADKYFDYIKEKYNESFAGFKKKPALGFIIAGYDEDEDDYHEYQILFSDSQVINPCLL